MYLWLRDFGQISKTVTEADMSREEVVGVCLTRRASLSPADSLELEGVAAVLLKHSAHLVTHPLHLLP